MLARNTAAAREPLARSLEPAPPGATGAAHGALHSVVALRESPLVSVVVVASHGRPEPLRRCLHALLVQSFDAEAFEIVVVDDGHDEETRTLVEALGAHTRAPVLRYLRASAGRGPAVARNAGWRAAWAPLIAFTDDDSLPAPDWLRCGTAAFEHGDAPERLMAVSGRVVVPPRDGAPHARPTDHELSTRGLEHAEFVCANAFVRKSALQAVGGFDERFQRAWREEPDLQFRLLEAGGTIGRSEEAVVVYAVPPEPWGASLRRQHNAYFDALLYKKHPRAYRERIERMPPWDHYAIVALTAAAPLLHATDQAGAAKLALFLAAGLVGRFALGRLRATSHAPAHVFEMLATSVLIPFLSVYWRLVGALRFRSFFL